MNNPSFSLSFEKVLSFRIIFESFIGVPLGFALGYYGNVSLVSAVGLFLNV